MKGQALMRISVFIKASQKDAVSSSTTWEHSKKAL